MGKIYEGENKLNVEQVCKALGDTVTTEQAKILVDVLNANAGIYASTKCKFAHMVLDAYRHLPSATDADMLTRKYCKHLMEKYMKSSATTENEETTFKTLIEAIKEKAGNK